MSLLALKTHTPGSESTIVQAFKKNFLILKRQAIQEPILATLQESKIQSPMEIKT
jgi:hypothetical protein